MAPSAASPDSSPGHVEVDLKNRYLAAGLAWLWPGAGHLYQGRYAEGALFMVCILGTFLFGLWISGGRSVYASFKSEDLRWQYICQLGVGAPALPALGQMWLRNGETSEPLFPVAYRNPYTYAVLSDEEAKVATAKITDAIMAPPIVSPNPNDPDMLAAWHKEFGAAFEMGTLYTMIAGLLNVLAMYDAYAGPARAAPEEEEPEDDAKHREPVKGAGEEAK